jgi:hypothetical protein
VREQVDDITSSLLSFEGEQYRTKVDGPIMDFLRCLEEMVGILRRALLFMLLKVSQWFLAYHT